MTRIVSAALLLLVCCFGSVRAGEPCGYLYQPAYAIDHYLRLPAEPYTPQPGDIFLAVTPDFIMRWGHRLAGAGDPHHSGIIFGRPDGSLAVLEAGPFNTIIVTGWDVMDHLRPMNTKSGCGFAGARRR